MRAVSAISFSLGPERTVPVAIVHPEEFYVAVGSRIIIDGRQSYSPDGAPLTYTWTIDSAPIGSTQAALVPLDAQDPSVVVLRADVLGPYEISLVVSTPYRTSSPVVSTIYVQSIQIPTLARIEPDGEIFFRTILDSFSSQLEQRDMLPVYWSGLKQLVAGDLLRLFQYEYATSIKNIQPWFQRRWIQIAPELTLVNEGQVILGNHQSGGDAFTQPNTTVVRGAIIDATTLLLTQGTASAAAVGQRLSIFVGPNAGTYTIDDLLPSSSGFKIHPENPFPSPSAEVLTSNSDLGGVAGSNSVTSPASNFTTTSPPVAVGDYVRIEDGANAGGYLVTSIVGTTGLTLDRPLRTSMVGASFSILSIKTGSYSVVRRPFTDTVLIPQASADLSKLERARLEGSGTINSPFELIVESRHVFASVVGKEVTITTGPNAGTKAVVAALNSSSTGYRLSTPLRPPFSSAGYAIPVVTGAADRLLTLGERSYEISSVALDTNRVSASLGGTGPVWVVKLATVDAPFDRTGLPWSIGSVFRSDATVDFESLGVSAGDVLYFEVARLDDSSKTRIPVGILGTRGNKISFSWGRAADGSVLDADIIAAASDLHIRSASIPEDTGVPTYEGLASAFLSEMSSFNFQSEYWNLGLRSTSSVMIQGYSFRGRAVAVRRNFRLPVADDLVSTPVLYEFVTDVAGSTLADGSYVYTAKDGTQVQLDRPPIELVEGRDFTVAGKRTLRGTSGSTVAGSDQVTLAGADLLRRGVDVGDVVEIQSGLDAGRYAVVQVLNESSVRVLGVNGAIPQTTAGALTYLIDKRVDGRFLTLASRFTPENPAPASLWAHTALYSNDAYIEDNFGVKVGVTRAQLDEYGVSQVSYLSAVRGLMYTWATNRSVLGMRTGCAIMAGLPVAEHRGVITAIEPDYSASLGRIIVASISDEGQRLGFEYAYIYGSSSEDYLPEFAGLATNPTTGRAYEEGDIVEQNAILTNGVIVNDWINSPGWGGTSPVSDLQKYHTWEVLVDAQQVDSRDLALILSFAQQAGPAHTVPSIKLVRFLADTLTFSEELIAETTVYLLDAPALSLEAQHATDAYASATSLRKIGIPTSGMRTLFEGMDLVTTAGSGIVTSARGGFVSTLTQIFPPFTDTIVTQGTQLVRQGDILLIMGGPNSGRYEVDSVDSNTQLTVIQVNPALPPVSPDIADISAATGQVFSIERRMQNPIVSGSDLATGIGTSTATSASGNFIWDGVAVGDSLVITSGNNRGVYEIVDVANGTTITISETFAYSATGDSFYVRRENLRSNPILSATDGQIVTGERRITTALGNPDLEGVRVDDELRITTGTYAGYTFRVVDVVGTDEIWINATLTVGMSPETGIEFTVVRPGDLAGGTDGDSDENLVVNFAYDPAVTAYYRPVTSLGTASVVAFTDGTPATADFGPVPPAAAIPALSAATVMEVQTGPNIGVYAVTGVTGQVVDVEIESWPDPSSVVGTAEFLDPASNFDVLNYTVTENTGLVNLEYLGVDLATPVALVGTLGVVGAAVTGVGTAFTPAMVGQLFRVTTDGVLAWTRIASVQSATALTLEEAYRGTDPTAPGASGEITPYLGGVIPGDQFVFSGGTYVVAQVVANVVTLTQDTTVNPLSAEAGEFRRRTW